MGDVFLVIQGTAYISFAKNLAFANLESLTHDNFVDAKPNFYDEARLAQINLRIREELGLYVVLATQRQAPTLPNFFIEAKGLDESAIVTKRQACFDDALGARGIHKLRSFEANSRLVHDNNAYTIISTYYDETLKLYTIHNIQAFNIEVSPKYYITQLNIFAITSTTKRFREEVIAFRNARD